MCFLHDSEMDYDRRCEFTRADLPYAVSGLVVVVSLVGLAAILFG